MKEGDGHRGHERGCNTRRRLGLKPAREDRGRGKAVTQEKSGSAKANYVLKDHPSSFSPHDRAAAHAHARTHAHICACVLAPLYPRIPPLFILTLY